MKAMRAHSHFLDHTADVGLEVWADNLPFLFEEAAIAMCGLCYDLKKVEKHVQIPVSIAMKSWEELLLHWLREILFLSELRHYVFCSFQIETDQVEKNGENHCLIKAMVYGEQLDPTRHEICTEIKAVTRHGLSLRERGRRWKAEILFDV